MLRRAGSPVTRIYEALQLHSAVELYAMIDISDGLTADLQHLCEESHCGAVLRAESIPIAADARKMADGRTPLDHALGDGEDFELLFAVAPEDGKRLAEAQPVVGISLVHIGECVEEGLWLEQQGKRMPLEPRGYVHELK